MKIKLFLLLFLNAQIALADIPLYWWEPSNGTNFGDALSQVLVERIIKQKVRKAIKWQHKLLAVGSILHFAKNSDIVWGSGINGKHLSFKDYHFNNLDVRAVRGPLSEKFLTEMGITNIPAIYGDPILLFPYFSPCFFPNLKLPLQGII